MVIMISMNIIHWKLTRFTRVWGTSPRARSYFGQVIEGEPFACAGSEELPVDSDDDTPNVKGSSSSKKTTCSGGVTTGKAYISANS